MIVIFASFIPEFFPKFFGDWQCNGCQYVFDKENSHYIGCGGGFNNVQREHSPTTHFGYRHFIWIIMGLTLFVIQIANLINNYNK
jgi:hypothetical protein